MTETVSLPFHPLADAFPLLEGSEFDELVASVREHGLFDPITLLDGSVLDGRNRYRACLAADVPPRFEEFSGDNPVVFVVAKNISRRHLNVSQRAMIAAKLATIPQHVHRRFFMADAQIPASAPPTVEEAAAMLSVAKGSVTHARTILERGTPEEVAQVESGVAAVNSVAQQIRDGVPPEDRKPRIKSDYSNRSDTQRAKAEIWRHFKEATALLSGMPHVEDAVRIIRGQDKAGITPERLASALQWLTEFSHEWERRNVEAA